MKNPTIFAFRHRLKAFVLLLSILICGVLPSAAVAQDPLPLQWIYMPITSVQGMAYSPDGKYLAVGGVGGVQVYAASSGKLVRCLPLPVDDNIGAVAFAKDSKTLAIGGKTSSGGILETWNAISGVQLAVLNTNATGGVVAVGFAPDGTTLAVGGSDANHGVLELWNTLTGALIRSPKSASTNAVSSVSFSPNGEMLVCGGSNYSTNSHSGFGTVEVWTVSTGSLLKSLSTQSTHIDAVAFSPDGKAIAGGGLIQLPFGNFNGSLEKWDVSTWTRTPIDTSESIVYAVAFSPDGKALAAGGLNGGSLELWNFANGGILPAPGSSCSTVYAVAYSPDGGKLSAGGMKVGIGTQSGRFDTAVIPTLASKTYNTPAYFDTASLADLAFSPDGNTVAVVGVGVLQLWNLSTHEIPISLPTSATNGNAVAISPDGQTLVVAGSGLPPSGSDISGIVELWSLATNKRIAKLPTVAMEVTSIAFSADGTTIACGGDCATGGALEVYSVATGGFRTLSSTLDYHVYSVAVSSNGKLIGIGGVTRKSSGNVGHVELWDATAGTRTRSLNTSSQQISSVALSPDAGMLAAGGYQAFGGILELWNVSNGSLASSPKLYADTSSVTSVAFAPAWNVLFCGTTGNLKSPNIQVFDTAKFTLLGAYKQVISRYNPYVKVAPDGAKFGFVDSPAIVVAGNAFTMKVSSVSLNPATIGGGGGSTVTVKISRPRLAGP